ncbi:glycosyltransferase [Paraconexibacter sp.]|uniref:glycosyltransferase n=1 Tax=Paraconexibacter sp. TaxID=2949640 RepID=UPI00356B1DB6
MRILAYTSPARGHLNPMMGALLACRERGAEIHVRTLASAVPDVRRAGLVAEAIDPRIEAIELDDHEERSPLAAAKRTYVVWGARAPHEVPDLRGAIDEVRPDALLVDTTTFGARAAAETAGLPWVESRPFLLEEPAPGIPPFGFGLRPRTDLLGRTRDRIMGAVMGRFERTAVLSTVNAGRQAAGLAPLDHPSEAYGRADRSLYFSAPPFEYARPPLPGVVAVGASEWEPPAEEDLEELDLLDDRPLVLVVCSSEYQNDGAIAVAALEGLTDRYQVVVTSAGVDPSGLEPRGGAVVRRFLPHGPLLERASVVVCHGGMGITQKALAAEVPVVVVPWGRDQLDVAMHVDVADAGVVVPRKKLTAARLADAVATASTKAEGARRVSAGYRATGGSEKAAEVILSLASAGATVVR